jgi:metal-dependent amidase/aminoacylase/carboxypeptidase family protein
MTIDPYAPAASDLVGLYQDLHAHPELSFQVTRTAAIVAGHLRKLGYQTTTSVGGARVVGILHNGQGPAVLLRADMDGLPVRKQTGWPTPAGRRAWAATARRFR